jgi:hypothetical protein
LRKDPSRFLCPSPPPSSIRVYSIPPYNKIRRVKGSGNCRFGTPSAFCSSPRESSGVRQEPRQCSLRYGVLESIRGALSRVHLPSYYTFPRSPSSIHVYSIPSYNKTQQLILSSRPQIPYSHATRIFTPIINLTCKPSDHPTSEVTIKIKRKAEADANFSRPSKRTKSTSSTLIRQSVRLSKRSVLRLPQELRDLVYDQF